MKFRLGMNTFQCDFALVFQNKFFFKYTLKRYVLNFKMPYIRNVFFKKNRGENRM